jgi:hypothetical protein
MNDLIKKAREVYATIEMLAPIYLGMKIAEAKKKVAKVRAWVLETLQLG